MLYYASIISDRPIALLVLDMLQFQHVPKLDMYSLILMETTNDMSFI